MCLIPRLARFFQGALDRDVLSARPLPTGWEYLEYGQFENVCDRYFFRAVQKKTRYMCFQFTIFMTRASKSNSQIFLPIVQFWNHGNGAPTSQVDTLDLAWMPGLFDHAW